MALEVAREWRGHPGFFDDFGMPYYHIFIYALRHLSRDKAREKLRWFDAFGATQAANPEDQKGWVRDQQILGGLVEH